MSLKHAILCLLDVEPASGYDLLKRFKEGVGFFWNASHQQIYAQLKTMTAAGWIAYTTEVQASKPDRKVYRLTDTGDQMLLAWMHKPVKVSKVNDALLVKLYAGHLVDAACLQQEMHHHRLCHQKMLDTYLGFEQLYQRLPAHKQEALALPYLTLRRGILAERAWLDWAAEAEVLLQRRQSRPPNNSR